MGFVVPGAPEVSTGKLVFGSFLEKPGSPVFAHANRLFSGAAALLIMLLTVTE